jgi:hypothetical protein
MNDVLIGILLLTLTGWPLQIEYGSSSAMVTPKGQHKPKITRIKCQTDVGIIRDDTLIIEFIQYPGRAYSWELMNADSTFTNLKLIRVKRHDPAKKPDSQEKVEFQFLGTKEGRETLTFKYFRPWESSKSAADSCIINIIIK